MNSNSNQGPSDLVAPGKASTAREGAEKRDPHFGGHSYDASLLRELLAVMYRDGGRYVAEHGIEKACTDAQALWLASPVAATGSPGKNCHPHPDAPHGFDRNRSRHEGRYVCECENWHPFRPSETPPGFDSTLEELLSEPVAEGENVEFYLQNGAGGVDAQIDAIMVREVLRTIVAKLAALREAA